MLKCITSVVIWLILGYGGLILIYINGEGFLRSIGDHLGTFKDRGKPRKPVMVWPVLGL